MHLEFIQRTAPRYKYIRTYGTKNVSKDMTGNIFLYVGKNKNLVHRLVSVFDFGYNTDSVQTAKSALEKMKEQRKSIIHVVILDTPFDQAELEDLLKMLQEAGPHFASIPVFYNIRQLNDENKKSLRHSRLVDEVLDLDIHLPDLPEKAGFFRKTKEVLLKTPGAPGKDLRINRLGDLPYLVKRAVDILICTSLLVILLPLFLLIALAIKLSSRGPVFYNEYRAGKGFNIFKFYKFRTLRVGADRLSTTLQQIRKGQGIEPSDIFRSYNEAWLTGIGKFLKRTKLDELPQLFNVMKGDMSMVGNKPLPLCEANRYTTNEWAERFIAPAGVTGLWKISGRSQSSISLDESLEMDINYARQYGLLMDFRIIFKSSRLFF